jgi:hypothetical protein
MKLNKSLIELVQNDCNNYKLIDVILSDFILRLLEYFIKLKI